MNVEFKHIEKNTIENIHVLEKLEKNMVAYEKQMKITEKRYRELINQLHR